MNIRNFQFTQMQSTPSQHQQHQQHQQQQHYQANSTNPTTNINNTNYVFNTPNSNRLPSVIVQTQQQQQQQHIQQQHQSYKEQPNISQQSAILHQQQQQQPIHQSQSQPQSQQYIVTSSTSSLHDHQQYMNNKYQEAYQQHLNHQPAHHQSQPQPQINTSQQLSSSSDHYYSRLTSSDSLSSEDLQNSHNSIPTLPDHHHQQPQQQSQSHSNMAGVYFNPRNTGFPMSMNSFPPIDGAGQMNTRMTGSPQWPNRFGPYGMPTHSGAPMYYLPTAQPGAQELGIFPHPSSDPPAPHELLPGDRLAHLPVYGSISPSSLVGIPPAFQNSFEGQIKIDLYHKPRGSKGTWMVINSGDQIRVTEGKGKRLKMIVHSEQELTKVGLQVALLDLQSANGSRRGSSSPASSSPSIGSTTPGSPTSTTTTNTNQIQPSPSSNVGQSTSSASSPSPTTTSSNSFHIHHGLNSSTTASPSPSSFSLSSPTQSPTQSPSQSNISPLIINNPSSNVSPFSVSISVTPPSQNPAPVLPLTHSSQLPQPDPQGLSVESVRVYRYPSLAQIPLSAIELELKLAKLSKRLCIVMAAQSKDGNNYEGRSVDFFAHNNGKHNANAMNRQNNSRRGPYSSPSISGEIGSLGASQHPLSSSTGSSPNINNKKTKTTTRSNSTNSLNANTAVNLGRGQPRSTSPTHHSNPPLPSIPLPSTLVDFSHNPQWQNFQTHLSAQIDQPWHHDSLPLYQHIQPPPPSHPSFADDKHS